jgi:hypothetical protein
MRRNVSAVKTVGALTLASVGLEAHDKFIEQFQIKKVYALDAGLIEFLLGKRTAETKYKSLEIVDVGLPFKNYPVFPDFSCDWLFLGPTLLSFKNEAGKKQFLACVLKLIAQIPPEETIFYKEHNGNERDYFAPRGYYELAWVLSNCVVVRPLLELMGKISPKFVRRKIDKLIASILYIRVFNRARSLQELTKYSGISVESFLPGVRKGLLGGLSNVMWGARYFNLPFYNCVDPQMRLGEAELKAGSDRLLDLNVEYFGYPFCEGKLNSPQAVTGRQLSPKIQDLISSLRLDLEHG